MRRTLFAVFLACTVVALSATAVSARTTITPSHGTYLGADHHGHTVAFTYSGHKIIDFRVGSNWSFPHATVSGHQVHHTCGGHPQHCIRGKWTDNHTFEGVWNNPNKGGDMKFTAFQYASR
jgi:hypothetical protein